MSNKNVNKLFTPLLDSIYRPDDGENKQKEFEESESMKKILWQYKEDVLNPDLPFINLTPECERIYLKAAMEGVSIGMNMAMGIITAPTLERNTIADGEAHELIN